ncbi:SRT-29 protein [Aphelenchoides avenae]|nr:SRT-29 protein [Aphelenchus avenae]
MNAPSSYFSYILFIQVFVISAVNVIGGIVYDLMIEQFIRVTFFVSVFSTFMWLSIHGTPGVVYLAMNRSVRKACLRFLGLDRIMGGVLPTVSNPSEFTLAVPSSRPGQQC